METEGVPPVEKKGDTLERTVMYILAAFGFAPIITFFVGIHIFNYMNHKTFMATDAAIMLALFVQMALCMFYMAVFPRAGYHSIYYAINFGLLVGIYRFTLSLSDKPPLSYNYEDVYEIIAFFIALDVALFIEYIRFRRADG